MSAAILCDISCELGEGPTFDPTTGTLFWFDIVGKKLFEKRIPDGDVVAHALPEMTSALAVVDHKRQLLVTETGLHLRDAESGAIIPHKAVEADNPATRSNDSRVLPCGALWFSTMSKAGGPPAGSIYWYRRGEVRKLFGDIAIPNAICFTLDGSVAYFTDTARNILMRVACDPATGLPSGEPVAFVDLSDQDQGIDGAVTDSEGVLWVARWGGGRIDAFSPDGRFLKSIAVPARQATCPVFVSAAATSMVVTSAYEGMDEAQRAADPQAGKTFLLQEVFNGRFDPPVDL